MSLNNPKVREAIKSPYQEYARPEDIIADRDLTIGEKVKILTSWKEDAEALLRAEAENMPADDTKDNPEDFLKRVSNLLIELEANS